MSILHAIVLAVVQGVTEFLPISSSGHLIVLPWIFHWKDSSSLTFDVMLHAGTLVAILAYFWNDWKRLILGSLVDLRNREFGKNLNSRMILLIILGSVPAGIAGVKLDKMVENGFRTMYLGVAAVMIAMGLLLYCADRFGRKERSVEKVGVRDAILIGVSQALALFPGVSRSGATITAGMFTGLTREASARFSFLLATPVILGASLIKLLEVVVHAAKHMPLDAPVSMMLVGFAVSAIVGYLAVAGLLRFLR
ncbi:MAG TPA: undecaprenyl-diphosphate phosphatase, partial [Armatimonadota bacterium]